MATRLTTDTSLNKLMNLDDNSYLRNRLKYHAASRIGIQTGQALGQAMNLDGHNVQASQVWTAPSSAFIKQSTAAKRTSTDGITTNEELVANFKDITKGGHKVKNLNNGEVWTNSNYPAVKLYLNCEMNAVTGSNGSGEKFESYELTDGNRIMDWIAPTSVKDNGLPVPGYTARIEAYKDGSWTDLQNCGDVEGMWALAQNNWEFAYMSGLCTFNPEATPAEWEYTKLRITAFAYVGEYLSDTISGNMFAITPFVFSLYNLPPIMDEDTLVGYEITIPGIVFNVFETSTGNAVGCDIYYLGGVNSGKTRIVIEDPEAITEFNTGASNPTQFTALAFTLGDGGLISMRSPVIIEPEPQEEEPQAEP